MVFIVFDIGGTNTRIAVSKDGETLDEPRKISTPKDFQEGVEMLKNISRELSGGESIEAVAGGIAGPLDRERARLINSPNLPDWIGKPLKENLRKALGAPVFIENDTAMVGLGEVHSGAGKGYDIAAYVTVSTGVGGVRLVDGAIDQSTFGFEVGHQVIDVGGALCPECVPCARCGLVDLEAMISGSATERRFGKKPYEITDKVLWDTYALWLAYGLNNMIVHWSPEAVVLGGAMVVKEVGIKVPDVLKHVKTILKIFPDAPEIKQAELQDIGGLYGSLAYIKQQRI